MARKPYTAFTDKLPKYNKRTGYWNGGGSKTLYTFKDKRTGQINVAPGSGNSRRASMFGRGIGEECTVRVATRSEATKHWQDPLNTGWYVAEGGGDENF